MSISAVLRSEGVSSWTLVLQTKRIMGRSLQQSRFRSKGFDPHASLPWSITERTHAMYTLPYTFGERCLGWRQAIFSWISPGHTTSGGYGDVRAPMAKQSATQIAESGFRIKLDAFDIHKSHWSVVDGLRLTFTPGADVVRISHQSFSDAAAFLVDPQLSLWALDRTITNTIAADST